MEGQVLVGVGARSSHGELAVYDDDAIRPLYFVIYDVSWWGPLLCANNGKGRDKVAPGLGLVDVGASAGISFALHLWFGDVSGEKWKI